MIERLGFDRQPPAVVCECSHCGAVEQIGRAAGWQLTFVSCLAIMREAWLEPRFSKHNPLDRSKAVSNTDSTCAAAQSQIPEVEYRDVPGCPGYRIGSDGTIWSCWVPRMHKNAQGTWHQLKVGYRHGYPMAKLNRVNGQRKSFAIHTLVLEVFVGPRPAGMECRHIDDNRANARLENLMWGTRSENCGDRRRNGRYYGARKLTAKDVLQIRALRTTKFQWERAVMFGVSQKAICKIDKGETWAWLK